MAESPPGGVLGRAPARRVLVGGSDASPRSTAAARSARVSGHLAWPARQGSHSHVSLRRSELVSTSAANPGERAAHRPLPRLVPAGAGLCAQPVQAIAGETADSTPQRGPERHAHSRSVRSLRKRSKSRSSVSRQETPCSRQTATIWESKTRFPIVPPSRTLSMSRRAYPGPGLRRVALGDDSRRATASHASSAECGGLKSLGWVTTRMNSPTQKTGIPQRAGDSASSVRRARAAAWRGSSARWA